MTNKLTKTVRPNNIHQTSGGKYQTFTNQNNIKKDKDYAECHVGGKNQSLNRPSTLTLNKFTAGLPTGAIVTKITVELKHSKAPYNNKNCNVPAPTVTLMDGDKPFKYSKTTKKTTKSWNKKTGKWEYKTVKVNEPISRKANAPTTKAAVSKLTFKHNWKYNKINSNDFGVKIDYPTNTNNNEGYIRLYYVKVTLTYRTANFSVKMKQLAGEYNGDEYKLSVTCSNVNNVMHIPTLTITAPEGFSLTGVNPEGVLTQVQNRVWTWLPKLGYNKGSDSIELTFDSYVTFSSNQESATGTFDVTESVNQHSSSKTVTILKTRPVDKELDPAIESDEKTITEEEATPLTAQIITLTVNQTFNFDLSNLSGNHNLYCCSVSNGNFAGFNLNNLSQVIREYDESTGAYSYQTYSSRQINFSNVTNLCISYVGQYTLVITPITDSSQILRIIYVDVKPSNLSNPDFVLLPLGDEELNRLGDGYTYTAQTYMKVNTSQVFVRDWGKNFKLGVFNEVIWRESAFSSEYVSYSFPTSGTVSINGTSYTNLGGNYFCVFTFDSSLLTEGAVRYDLKLNVPAYHHSQGTVLRAVDEINSSAMQFGIRVPEDIDAILTILNEDNETLHEFHIRLKDTLSVKTLTSASADSLTTQEIIDNAQWSNLPLKPNTYGNLTVKFAYNENYPVYLIITGDYPTAPFASIDFTEPAIIEDYDSWKGNGVYPQPILNSISEDDFSEIEILANMASDTLILYDFHIDDDFINEDIAIRGIAITGLMDSNSDDMIINTTIVNGENNSKNRSVVLDENSPVSYTDNEFTIGQVGDLFGFKTNEITDLKDWEVRLSLSNVLNGFDAKASFGNLDLVVYAEDVVDQQYRCVVEDEDLAYYGVLLQDVSIPAGLKTDTDYITVDGTDVNSPYRQNIARKTIEIEFEIDSCDLETSTLALREVIRLLTTKRDKNIPIPKKIQFSHYPDVFWEYIMEEPVDAEAEISGYKCKAKLVVPAGTSYDLNHTFTSNTGYVSGLAAVHPVIQFSPAENVICIRETLSGQEFNMGYSGDWMGKIVEIDCDDRICWLKESEDDNDPVNISASVDFNVDWFVLDGEYSFESVGCAIRSIEWQERW